ncbi:MAG: histidine kinase [Saprospiraceae bacterium]
MGKVQCFRFLLGFGLALLQALPVFSQIKTHVFHQLSVEQGLTSGEYNYYVYQDREGLVWISSIAGLNRFDGRRVKQYLPVAGDPHSLFEVTASLSRFYEDREGRLWFTNKDGLIRYDRPNDRFDRIRIAMPGGDTLAAVYQWMHLDTLSGEIWVNIGDDLYSFPASDPAKASYIGPYIAGVKDRMVPSPASGQYLLKMGRKSGGLRVLHFMDGKEAEAARLFATPDGTGINDALYRSDSLVWTAGEGGLRPLDLRTGSWGAAATFRGKTINGIIELALCRDGRILAATQERGLYLFDPAQGAFAEQLLTLKDGKAVPFQPQIDRIYVDRSNNLWISTAADGIFYTHLDKPRFDIGLAKEADRYGSVMGISQSASGALWLLFTREAVRIQGGDTAYYSLPIAGRGVERATFIYEDRAGRVWVGTLQSLFLLRPGERAFAEAHILPEGSRDQPGYHSMAELPDGSLTVATNVRSVLHLSQDMRHSRWLEGAPVNPVSIAFWKTGYLFVNATDNTFHIWRWENGRLRKDTTLNGVPYTVGMAFDERRNCYWLAALSGLWQVAQDPAGRWISREKEGIPVRSISSVSVCGAGNLWMGSSRGLLVFNPDTGESQVFGIEDGLPSLGFIQGAILARPDGALLFGTGNGLCIVHPEKAVVSRVPPARPAILDIRINQEPGVAHLYNVDPFLNPAFIRKLRLPYTKNNLYFRLSAREYSAPAKCRYRYRLSGSTDERVVEMGFNDELNFTNLSPGRYTLQVWAANSDGVWSEKPVELSIEIRPPWYQTWPFYLAITLALAGLFYAMYRYRVREVMQRERLQREASELRRQAAETETAVLRLQMDPHFIFNSMNSIDAFILQGDKATAHDYLVRFADLMRAILNNSAQAMTNLEGEIELLEKYLRTEQMRIGARMQYAFEVAPEVDTYDEQIPTMILQPFVENAIWHGISPKAGPGKIVVSFRYEGEALVCEVSDDGVGRGHSPSVKKHGSKALSITERRLALLAASYPEHQPRFEIIDKKDENGAPAGTAVRFYFPRAASESGFPG